MSKRSELVLPPGTFAYSLDRANAKMSVLVGPLQNKLEEQEGAVVWDPNKGRTTGCPVDRAVQSIVIVPADSFAVITNPYVVDGKLHQPPAKRKTQVDEIELQYGRAEHVSGPTAIVPWPGQDVTVRKRFQLARDQYVCIEVTELLSDEANEALATVTGRDPDLPPFRPGDQAIIMGQQATLFTPPTGVKVLGNQVKSGQHVKAFEWARLRASDGTCRYVRGPELVFPRDNEKVETTGKAVDLTKAGVHVRRLVDVEDSPAGEELFLCQFDADENKPKQYWWPSEQVELIETIEPTEVPEGGGVYVRERGRGDAAISIYKANAPVLFSPLTWELVPRDGSVFAPAVVVQDNEAVEINSPKGSRVVVGPKVTLLEYTEQEGERIKVSDYFETKTGYADTSDGVNVFANVSLTSTLTGEPAEWFRTPGSRDRIRNAIEALFRSSIGKFTAAQVEAKARLLVDTFTLDLPGITVSDVDVQVWFAEPEVHKAVVQNRMTATMNRLVEQQRQLEQQSEKVCQDHEAAMAAMTEAAIERNRLTALAEAKAKADAKKLELDAEKSMQDVLDELATYELDREARRNQQAVEQRKREVELERQKLEAQAAASVEVLGAIQPHLIEAVKMAGAQTSFSKVVQHLGPASILQGVGLQDALAKVVGSDAASALLLTGSGAPDKSNGRTKRPNAEP